VGGAGARALLRGAAGCCRAAEVRVLMPPRGHSSTACCALLPAAAAPAAEDKPAEAAPAEAEAADGDGARLLPAPCSLRLLALPAVRSPSGLQQPLPQRPPPSFAPSPQPLPPPPPPPAQATTTATWRPPPPPARS
jgi:hypothetical protein